MHIKDTRLTSQKGFVELSFAKLVYASILLMVSCIVNQELLCDL